jgi:putative tricarboxylic transport membrane protein
VSDARTGAHRPWGEVIAFAVLVLIGIMFVASSFGYGVLQDRGRIGPGFLPLVLGVLLILLSGAQLLGRLRAPVPEPPEHHHYYPARETPVAGAHVMLDRQHEEHPELGVDIMGRTAGFRVRQLWMVVAAIAVTIAVVPYLGFLLAFAALILFISIVVEGRRIVPALLITLSAIGVVYGVFVAFLNVPLPSGPLGF